MQAPAAAGQAAACGAMPATRPTAAEAAAAAAAAPPRDAEVIEIDLAAEEEEQSIDLSGDSDEEDIAENFDNYVFTSDSEAEERVDAASDEDADSESSLEWEFEVVGSVDGANGADAAAAAAAAQAPARCGFIDLTGPDGDDEEEGDSSNSQQQQRQFQQAAPRLPHESGSQQPKSIWAHMQQQLRHGQQHQQQARQQPRQQRQQQRRQQPAAAAAAAAPAAAAAAGPQDGRRGNVLDLFVDGSYRRMLVVGGSKPRLMMGMAGGVWAPNMRALQDRWLLQGGGGQPDSLRAELGAVFVGAVRLKTVLDNDGLPGGWRPSAIVIHSDCKSVIQFLHPDYALKSDKYRGLVTAVRARLTALRRLLPISLRWVKGHQGQNSNPLAIGNNGAHKQAKACNMFSTVCELPVHAGG